ncbi:MAG: hypothetical protein RLP44_19070 [Aggregatilineales bacterium]
MQSIILIGPMRAGKTTVSKLVAEKLNLPRVRLDEIRWDYYPTVGYDEDHAKSLRKSGGLDFFTYMKPFEASLVEHVLTLHPEDTVIDFGAGHSVYEQEALFQQVQKALEPFPHVIYITPCSDVEEAVEILNQRDIDDGESGLPAELNRHFVTHPSNSILATHTIYNQDQTPAQSAEQIVRLLG